MQLQTVDTVNSITGKLFRERYFNKQIPVVIKDMAKEWPAYARWNWNYFKSILGHIYVGIYDNQKRHSQIISNGADDFTTIGRYIDMIRSGPSAWRIFLFNMFNYAPKLTKDFTWPDHLMNSFDKATPMLFVGGEGSITHMQFQTQLNHTLHSQFLGRKRVLLFPYSEQHKLYRVPFEAMSTVDFTNYYDVDKSKIEWDKFEALKFAKGFEITLEHGDTLFIPSGYWYHMEYLENGMAMSLQSKASLATRLKGHWTTKGHNNIDLFMKRFAPIAWNEWKMKKMNDLAAQSILQSRRGGDNSMVTAPGC